MNHRTTFIAALALATTACESGSDDDDGGGDTANVSDGGSAGMDDGSSGTPGTSQGDDDSPADSSSGGAPALDCASYCSTFEAACVDFQPYANTEECMDHCAQWPVGAESDTAGDTLGCRLYHATVAGTADPDVHCPHASPNGDLTCVAADAPACDDYCTTFLANCTGDLNVYADMDDCMTQCEPWYQGTTADTQGNTVGCRLYHAGAPAVDDPEMHCPHAAAGGGGVCAFPP